MAQLVDIREINVDISECNFL